MNPTGNEQPLASSRCSWLSVVRAPIAAQEGTGGGWVSVEIKREGREDIGKWKRGIRGRGWSEAAIEINLPLPLTLFSPLPLPLSLTNKKILTLTIAQKLRAHRVEQLRADGDAEAGDRAQERARGGEAGGGVWGVGG